MARDFYKTLGLKQKDKPNGDEIKKAYRQMALKYHPDKCDAEDAEERFKEVYRAYDVLSNDEKRAIYDEFGEEGLNDDGLGDAEAWRSLYKKVTAELIDDYLAKYKGSDDERNDLKGHYTRCKGDMDKIYEHLIGFDVAEEERYRTIIQGLIDSEEVRPYPKFVNETPQQREKRRKRAEKEAKQARKLKRKAEEAGVGDRDDETENGGGGMAGLALALQANAKRRANFVDDLERKYCGGGGSGGVGSGGATASKGKKKGRKGAGGGQRR